jgi:hypothetical protein
MIAESVYILCAMTSTLCATMLYRKYRQTSLRLLLWSCLCFVGLAINNVILFLDLVVFPSGPDLSVIRTIPAVIGVGLLIYGFIWESV